MRLVGKSGREDVAIVYVAELDGGRLVEFAESIQPGLPREKKWVLTLSTLLGCPVGCPFCDAGAYYEGKLSRREILCQLAHMVESRFPDRVVPVEKFKVQFARMGEPALNESVLDVLEAIPELYEAPGLMPSVSTVAPRGCERFLEKLFEIKERSYGGMFQLQFSIHSTDPVQRDRLIPIRRLSLEEIGGLGRAFHRPGERKITLNFALAEGSIIDPLVLSEHFPPADFLIKLTPVNPTYRAARNGIKSGVDPDEPANPVVNGLREAGYDVILSVGELEENAIGSNCGQHIMNYLGSGWGSENAYGSVPDELARRAGTQLS